MTLVEIKNKDRIKKAIVEAIAFFDMFDYPLTEMELWQFVSVKCEFVDIKTAVTGEKLKNITQEKNGFHFLNGRSEIVVTRMRRYNYASRKFKRAIRLAKIFKIIPWIKMIAVGNIMGVNNLKDGSDIDLFIITEPNKIWLTRFFCVAITQLFGWRPKKGDTRDKICLSFFVSEKGADMRKLMLDKTVTHPDPRGGLPLSRGDSEDIYIIYWLAGLVPIYDTGGVYEKFIEANGWIYDDMPNWLTVEPLKSRIAGKRWSIFYYDIIDILFGGLEQYFKKWQLKIMPQDMKEIMNKDTRVVASDDVIKMHFNDRREEYLNKFKVQSKKLYKNILENPSR